MRPDCGFDDLFYEFNGEAVHWGGGTSEWQRVGSGRDEVKALFGVNEMLNHLDFLIRAHPLLTSVCGACSKNDVVTGVVVAVHDVVVPAPWRANSMIEVPVRICQHLSRDLIERLSEIAPNMAILWTKGVDYIPALL